MAQGSNRFDPAAVARLNRKFEAMPGAVRAALREAIEQGGGEMVDMASRLAKKGETGKIAESNELEMAPGDEPSAVVRNTDFRAKFQEFGVAPHVIKPSRRGGKKGLAEAPDGAFFGKKIDHPGHAPQPFFFPSWRALKRRIMNRMSRKSREAVRKVARGG